MLAKVPYLREDDKTGVLRFRRIFPEGLRPFLGGKWRGRGELKLTLKARTIHEPGAMLLYHEAARLYDKLVAQARKVADGHFDELTVPRIAFLVATYCHQELTDDDLLRLDPVAKARGEQVTRAAIDAGFAVPPHRPTAHWSQGMRIAIEAALDVHRGLSADGDVDGILDAWSDRAVDLAASQGLYLDQTKPAFRDLCVRLNEGAIAAYEVQLKRLDGQIIATPPAPVAPATKPSRPAVLEAPEGSTFSAIILELIEKPRHGFKEPTKERVRGGLRFLVEALGDLRPAELTRDRVTTFLDLLAQRPAKLGKGERDTPLPDLVSRYAERPEVPRLTQKTQEAYVIALNARWKDAQRDGPIPRTLASPFSDRTYARAAGRRKTATGFSAKELRAYFSMPPFTSGERPVRGKGEAVYWIPLLMLFTGARPEEVAQLLVADIFQRDGDGRWVLRFTNEGMHPVKGRQSLKTEGYEHGKRTFLIPMPLIDLGLRRYHQALQDAGELALFPLLRRKGKRSGIYASFGEWMGPYVYDHGVLEPGTGRQPVRELRHTWSTAARVSRIPKEAMKYIQGHKDEDDRSSSDDYGQFEALGDRLDELQLPINVSELVKPWMPAR